jgi:predicted nucleic acid-binding protein
VSNRNIALPRRVFIDSSAYYALVDERERDALTARQIVRELARIRAATFTTNFVAAETHALILRRRGHHAALRFLDNVDRGATTIVRVTEHDEREARAIIHRYADKDFSLTDALSFAVMQRLRIPAAFTFDDDFRQFGVAVLSVE